MTPLEIIEETVAWYAADPSRRAVIRRRGGEYPTAHYRTADGRTCAIGRVMTLQGVRTFQRNPAPVDAILLAAHSEFLADTAVGDPQWCFREPYRGWSNEFWFDLQRLHDNDRYWCDEGLTDEGQGLVFEMREKYASPGTCMTEYAANKQRK